MTLSDVMSHAGLAFYAEVAMVLFLIVFVTVAVRAVWPGRTRELEEAGRLPFDDEPERGADTSPGARS